jgi:hypothetical protein
MRTLIKIDRRAKENNEKAYWKGHFPGIFGKLKPINSFFKAKWSAANSR